MKRNGRLSWREVIAALAVIVALGVMMSSYSGIQKKRNQLQRRLGDLRELQSLGQLKVSQAEAFQRWVDQGEHRYDLAALIDQHLGGVKVDKASRESFALMDGWTLNRYDVRLDNVPPGKLSEFLAGCENARPPVRIMDIQITLSSDTASPNYTAQLALAEITR